MQYKLPPIEIPQTKPFQNDALGRGPAVEAVSTLIEDLKGPFVLAIDSPWGTGKTTFIKFLKVDLESKGFTCVYFNAWETDFTTDPLIAFIGEMGKLESRVAQRSPEFAEHYKKAKKIGTLLAKKTVTVGAKLVSAGILNVEEIMETAISDYISSSVSDAVDAYMAEKSLNEQFHTALSKTIEKLNEKGKRPQIVIFVDELDRCRPNYAVELLERVKHLFNVENAIFVISLDKEQLHVSLGAVYGREINSDEYLRRFIDIEYALPKPDSESFTKNLFIRFGFDEFFSERTNHELQKEKGDLISTFTALSQHLGLSLRAREQCFTRIRVAMMMTPQDHFLFPQLLATLALLKAGAKPIYREYAFGNGTAKGVLDYLRTLDGGEELINSHFGTVIEASLVSAKAGRFMDHGVTADYVNIANDETATEKDRERATKILAICRNWSFRGNGPELDYVVRKLELAAQFKV